jgi:hypothetical protein
MKFNLANNAEAGKALDHLLTLTRDGKIAEVKEIKPRRTLPQNSYLHLLFGAFGLETGNTIENAKALYKWVNKDLYYREKKMGGETFVHIRSSADLNKEEMAKSIDRFMEWAAQHGYPLPPADNPEALRSLENTIEQQSHYL